MAAIKTIRIHPAIGIARVGNSPNRFFIGPELPGNRKPPAGGYKDAHGRVKRQAARFRLFGYDKNGKLVREITAADARITWTVHLANKKAEWVQFQGPQSSTNPNLRRNSSEKNRNSLIIDPGSRSVTGPKKSSRFDTGSFLGTIVPLGEIRSDPQGRLLVLGGFGNSASPINGQLQWANSVGWHDDVSDGPVMASVTLKGTTKAIPAVPAWVICGPPKFAPPIDNIITLYDLLFQVAVDKLGLSVPAKPSFTNDVFPILQRAMTTKWVSEMAAPHHGTLAAVIPPPGSAAARQAIFDRLRDPNVPLNQPTSGDMPMIWSDIYDTVQVLSQPLTKTQYNVMKKWKDGNFINDWSGPPAPGTDITPAGLDRAALENCVGGAFFPGIEASWLLRDAYSYSEPFRLDQSDLRPGDVTKQMALPWQADFYDCSVYKGLAWWPAPRPDDVFTKAGGTQVAWTRDLVGSMEEMVEKWHRLGFVVKKGSSYLETERGS